ncbi:uncharacterized protein Dmoj_GI26830, isoform D [Drosophila mojavensis]|nr:uncharacterized protein Dmoj_GI26830, isoform D [Drosophila mojavensis]
MAARPVEGGRTRTSEAGNQGVMQQISGDIQRDIQGVQWNQPCNQQQHWHLGGQHQLLH